jgi:acyl dehydratase
LTATLEPTADLLAYLGRAAGPPRHSPTPVDEGAIRAWCHALGDSLPVYRDAELAAGTRWRGIIAPPTMLQAWTMHDRRQAPEPEVMDFAEGELMAKLAAAGYTAVVATNCEQSYVRPLRPGDRVTSRTTIADITGPKRTALGEGFFVTLQTDYADAAGEPVGTMRFRSLRYRAAKRRSETPPPRPPAISSNPTDVVGRTIGPAVTVTRRYDDVVVGDELSPLEIYVTPTLIISGAIASRDFNVLHHDRDRAIAAGAADIFMNILTTNGLVGRFVTEWAGPEAVLERVAIRLGAANYPYDTFRLSARVTACDQRAGHGVAELEVRGTNSLGDHVTGSVEVGLP